MAMAARGRWLFQRTLLLGRCHCYSSTGLHTTASPHTSPLDKYTGTASPLAGKSDSEVFRGWLVFKLLTYDWIIEKSLTLYSLSKKILGLGLTARILRATVAGQFLGGFSEEETARVADSLAEKKICSLWNYSAEQDLSDGLGDVPEQEAQYDVINDMYLRSIVLAGKHNYQASPVKAVAIKVTAIVNPHVLLKLSQMLIGALEVARQKQGKGDLCDLSPAGEQRRTEATEWLSDLTLPANLSRLQEVCQEHEVGVAPLTDTELEQLNGLVRRMDDMGECSKREGVRVFVDAEEYRLQPAISHLTVHHMMAKFNHTQPLIYNTIQMYLKSSFETLLMDIAAAKSAGFQYGIKMVRGAYMEVEKEVTREFGVEYPVHPNKEATNNSYNRGMRHTMGEIARGEVVKGMLVASHNKDTVELGLQTLEELGIPRESGAVCFGQLQGMGDHLSYPLAGAGFILQKFVPYGDMEVVFPYLVRRGQENDTTSVNATLERRLYAEERARRRKK